MHQSEYFNKYKQVDKMMFLSLGKPSPIKF